MDRDRFLAIGSSLISLNYYFYPADIESNIIKKENGWFIPTVHQRTINEQQKCWLYIPNADFNFAAIAAIHRHPQLQKLGVYAIDKKYLMLTKSQKNENPAQEEFTSWDQWLAECRQEIPFWLAPGKSPVKRLAWSTDIHLNFLEDENIQQYCDQVLQQQADALLLTGDIAEGHDLEMYFERLSQALGIPIYFVLGNHDYYGFSLEQVQAQLHDVCKNIPHLFWLDQSDPIPLNSQTALIGHNGWNDARYGDFLKSEILLNDYLVIQDLAKAISPDNQKRGRLVMKSEGKQPLQKKLQELGNIAAASLRTQLLSALSQYRHVILLTHVPPFVEASIHQGQPSNAEWLPHMTCKAVGDMIQEIMPQFPEHQLLVLCGHVHSIGATWALPNVLVLTGSAEYGHPCVQHVFELEE